MKDSNTTLRADEVEEALVSRRQVANRWSTSIATVKRRQADGLLHPIYFSRRQVRYRLSEIISIERAAEGGGA
jgi:hypothetical protein